MNAKKDNELKNHLLILDAINDLRTEFKEDLIRVEDNIREQIKLIDSKQNTFIENLNEQNILINDNNFNRNLEFAKVDQRIKMLEQFRYVLLLTIFLGCAVGSSIVAELPRILKFFGYLY